MLGVLHLLLHVLFWAFCDKPALLVLFSPPNALLARNPCRIVSGASEGGKNRKGARPCHKCAGKLETIGGSGKEGRQAGICFPFEIRTCSFRSFFPSDAFIKCLRLGILICRLFWVSERRGRLAQVFLPKIKAITPEDSHPIPSPYPLLSLRTRTCMQRPSPPRCSGYGGWCTRCPPVGRLAKSVLN